MTKVTVRVVDCYVFNLLGDSPEFLILKRNKNKIYEHLWQGVAGKIEKGESAWQTAIRELKEETGLDPLNIFVADHVSRFYETNGDRINLVPVFGIEVDSKDVSQAFLSLALMNKTTGALLTVDGGNAAAMVR